MQSSARLNVRHPLSLTLLVGLGLTASACEDETVGQLTVKAVFDPAEIDFGDVPVGMTKVKPTTLRNTGSVAMEISEALVPLPFTIAGKATLVGEKIAAGAPMPIDVGFISSQEGPVEATIQVKSGRATAELKVKANGVLVRLPSIVVEPSQLDFGSIEVGTEARKTVTVRNEGNAPGTIESTLLVNGTGAYQLDPAAPFTVEPGQSVRHEVVFKATQQGPQPDVMNFQVNELPDPVPLTLNGGGAVALGEMICRPASVDFGQVGRGEVAERTVACTAGGGPVRIISTVIRDRDQYFSVRGNAGPRDVAANQAAEIVVQYAPQGLPMPHRSVLTVNYNGADGQASVDVPLSGEIVPPPPTTTAISVVLRWNTNLTDVDLHLVRPGGTPFNRDDGSDCFYLNRTPDWGVRNDPSDNPFLDVDDTDGLGPENINLTQTAAGEYRVLIHYFRAFLAQTEATVEVYVGGTLAGTFTRPLECDDIWEVGIVDWNGTSGTFRHTNTVTPDSRRGACGLIAPAP